MTEQDIEAALSVSYVYTVAARAGAIIFNPTLDYGIDGSLHEVRKVNGQRVQCGATIHYQLKASRRCIEKETKITYTLKKDAYNRFVAIKNNSAVPCILLLLCLPPDPNEWFEIREDYLQLRKCCYWFHWKETTPTEKTSVNIPIPRSQRFTPETLNMLFELYNRGELR